MSGIASANILVFTPLVSKDRIACKGHSSSSDWLRSSDQLVGILAVPPK